MPANADQPDWGKDNLPGSKNAGNYAKVEWGIGNQVASTYLRLYILPTQAQTAF
jgi:hypothetical protein